MHTEISTRERLTTQERDRKREQNRLAQRRCRALKSKGICVYAVHASPIVIEALIARSEDAGLSAERAERDSRNPEKVGIDLADVLTEWARQYLKNRHA
jgi:hypothetical protein